MPEKVFPFKRSLVDELCSRTPTPFYVYDAAGILSRSKALCDAFAWSEGFRNCFAVKATPNPSIVSLLAENGSGMDCSSMAELVMCEKCGVTGERIIFTSNDTPDEEFRKAYELGAIINIDDISHIECVERAIGHLPEIMCCRFNPGAAKAGNSIIGNPEEAKYGLTRLQMIEAYKIMRDKGVKRFGVHTMVASNERNAEYFVETARIVFDLIADIHRELGIDFEFADLGGGVGIPYRPEDDEVDLEAVSAGVKREMERILVAAGIKAPRLMFECGRTITGPCGWLIAKVIHFKDTYRKYAGLDACMANLMRPALYGAYHHITVFGKENAPCTEVYDVTGSLCENNDKFAIARALPALEIGDMVAIHDAGAHGHAMGFNYNGKLRSAEWLIMPSGEARLIRRAETLNDLFATLEPQIKV